eukprot:scaffold9114_cov66-Phaeocystis_antarctica.AAC.3
MAPPARRSADCGGAALRDGLPRAHGGADVLRPLGDGRGRERARGVVHLLGERVLVVRQRALLPRRLRGHVGEEEPVDSALGARREEAALQRGALVQPEQPARGGRQPALPARVDDVHLHDVALLGGQAEHELAQPQMAREIRLPRVAVRAPRREVAPGEAQPRHGRRTLERRVRALAERHHARQRCRRRPELYRPQQRRRWRSLAPLPPPGLPSRRGRELRALGLVAAHRADHLIEQQLAQQEGPEVVGACCLLPAARPCAERGQHLVGAVDQNVQRLVPLDHALGKLPHRRRVGQVELRRLARAIALLAPAGRSDPAAPAGRTLRLPRREDDARSQLC